MAQGPEDKPPREQADRSKAGFDDVWGELIGDGGDAPTPVAPTPSSPISVEDAARVASDDDADETTGATKPWTDQARTAPLREVEHEADADVRMEVLMTEAGKQAADKAAASDGVAPGGVAKGASEISAATSSPRLQRPDEEMDRLMSGEAAIPEATPAVGEAKAAAKTEAKGEPAPNDAEAAPDEAAAKKETGPDEAVAKDEAASEATAASTEDTAAKNEDAASRQSAASQAAAPAEETAAKNKGASAQHSAGPKGAAPTDEAAAKKKAGAEQSATPKTESAADEADAVAEEAAADEAARDEGASDEAAARKRTGAAVARGDARADADRPRAAARAQERPSSVESRAAADEGGGGGWMWIAAAVVLGGIGLWSVMGGDDDEPPRDVAPTEQTQPAERPARVAERDDPVRPPERPSLAPDPVDVDDTPVDPQGGAGSDDVVPDDADEDPPAGDDGAQPAAVQDDATEDDAGGGGDDAASPSADEDAAPPTTTGDVRKPPAGTPPEHADALSRLPVAPDDRAPVGGVGKSGVHVDRISLGPVYEKGECTGGSDTVSVEERKRFNVCLRVVHPREKEEVIVLWQKDGGTVRRGKVAIPASHAYRTRAYLLLRDEYVGKWTVRVMSDDGTELASHAFTVVE